MSSIITTLQTGMELPTREHTASNVSLFLYNAAVWNAHRIHYDETYTTEVEKHPGVVIDGPLQGDWLCQVALNWLADPTLAAGALCEFSYSNRRAAYLGETLTSGGHITDIDLSSHKVQLELFIKNANGDIITPGSAVVQFDS